jgi:hypothetical protein
MHGGITDEEGSRVALTLRGRLGRSDYGLVWNRVLETCRVLVGDTSSACSADQPMSSCKRLLMTPTGMADGPSAV